MPRARAVEVVAKAHSYRGIGMPLTVTASFSVSGAMDFLSSTFPRQTTATPPGWLPKRKQFSQRCRSDAQFVNLSASDSQGDQREALDVATLVRRSP